MKHLSLLLIACAACTAQTATSPADEAAIKNVVARYVDARDHKDAKATLADVNLSVSDIITTDHRLQGYFRICDPT